MRFSNVEDNNIEFQTSNLNSIKVSSVLKLNIASFDGQVQVLFTTVKFSNVRRHEYQI